MSDIYYALVIGIIVFLGGILFIRVKLYDLEEQIKQLLILIIGGNE